jgi:hypothetical protein
MAVKPEVIGDVEEGEPRLPAETDELGLTADERAQWDEMQAAAKEQAPAEGEEAPDEVTPAPAKPDAEAAAAKPDADEPAEGEDEGEEAAEAAPAIDPKTGKPPQKQVNWNKHQRELRKRDDRLAAAETKLREESEARIKLGERLAILNEALTAPAPVDPQVAQQQAVAANPMLEPDIKVEDDALGAIAQLQRRNAFLQNQLQGTQEETQIEREERGLKEDFQRDADMYARTEDGHHFGAAYQFLKDSRLTELAISLFDKDPTDPAQVFTQAEINKLVADFNAEEKWVVANARKAGKSPSAAIMKLAKGRGFKPQVAQAQAAPAAAPAAPAVAPVKNGNGGAPAPTADAVSKIKAEAEAAAASRSLSDGGGAPPGEPLTPERLLKMSDKEFGEYVDRLPKENLDALMGRPQMAR